MKKQLTFLLFLLPFVATGAKTVYKVTNPDYIGINQGSMEITSVKTTEKATIVTFKYSGEGFGYFNPKVHLIDEQGLFYKIIGQKGFHKDSLERFIPKKKGRYELHFQPLSANTQVFDLIEDAYSMGSAKYYGIREKGIPFSVTNPLLHNEGETSLPDIDFKRDTVVITGHVIKNTSGKNLYNKVTKHHYYSFRLDNKAQTVNIDEYGNFQMKLRVYGPTWSYLLINPGGMFVPVMLYPGDSINLQIDLDADKKVTYNSQNKKEFSKLMQCAPILSTYRNKWKRDTLDYKQITNESVKRRFEELDSLGLYLSGKYGLNRVETEMLRSHLSVMTAIDIVATTSYYLFKRYPRPESRKEEWEWLNADSPFFSCISNVRAESNVFLATPCWSELLSNHYLRENPRYYNLDANFHEKWMETKGELVKPYYDEKLQLIREYRGKDKNDNIFEQAYLLSNIVSMPFFVSTIGDVENTLPFLLQQFTEFRKLFYHPSVIRIASSLIHEYEQDEYSKQERFWNKKLEKEKQ